MPEQKKTVAQQIIQQQGARIEYLVLRNSEGKENFFCIAISEEQYQDMQKKINDGSSINPSEYGIVLYQCVGNEPPEEFEKIINDLIKEEDQ